MRSTIFELMSTVRERVIILDWPCDFLKNKTHSGGHVEKAIFSADNKSRVFSVRSKWNHYFKWI